MLVELKRLDGKSVQLPSEAIFRVRPAIKSVEPRAVAVVHYDLDTRDPRYDTLASKETIRQVIGRISKELPMVLFSSPSGTPVYLDASKVVSVDQPDTGLHYPGTRAVVHVLTQYQQVAETVTEVGNRVRAALEAWRSSHPDA